MDPTTATLEEEREWDASARLTTVIEAAQYAILRDDQVDLVVSDRGALRTVVLTYEDGIHYDGDGTLQMSLVQEKLEEDAWEVTREWAECERHLVEGSNHLISD